MRRVYVRADATERGYPPFQPDCLEWADTVPKYQVQIDAHNFLVDIDGSTAKRGFITFRYVEADNPTAAEHVAVQMLRDDQDLRIMVKNDKSDPPVMDVIEIAELESFQGTKSQPGRIWYDMKPKRWWQIWRQ